MESVVEEEGGAAVYIINTYLPPIRKMSLYVYIKKTGVKVSLHQKFFFIFSPHYTCKEREGKEIDFFLTCKKYPGGDGGGF